MWYYNVFSRKKSLFSTFNTSPFQVYGSSKDLKDKCGIEVKQEGHKLSVNASNKDGDQHAHDFKCVIEVDILIAINMQYITDIEY